MQTKYGVLRGIEDIEYYKDGSIKLCRVNEKNVLKTALGELVPQYETKDERRKITGTLEFYENGDLMSICLDEQITVATAYGDIPTEKISFYKGEKIKRIFPLNGKLSGYWGEDNEYSLATSIVIKNGEYEITSKFISIAFYENQTLRSLTLWPKERIELTTDMGIIKVRKGISFYENGKIKSFEPATEIRVKTPIGEISAFDNEIIGLHGDENSVQFDITGEIRALCTCNDRVKIFNGSITEIMEPTLKKGWCNELIEVPVPLKISFGENSIIFGDKSSFNIQNNSFFVEKINYKNLSEEISC